jgi:hypothetical protein
VPQVYLNGGAAPTTWVTQGTYFGINMVSGFTGNAIDIHNNGGNSLFSVGSIGNVTAAGNIVTGGASIFSFSARGILSSPAAGSMQFGNIDAAGAPTAQTIRLQSASGVLNTAGANGVIQMSAGTGTGAGGGLSFQYAAAAGSASTKNTFATVGDYSVTTAGSWTFANAVSLPNLAASSAATTGTVCWTTGGNLTVDTTLACLASLETLKNIHGPIGDASSIVSRLEPFWYSWKEGTVQRDGDKQEQPGFGANQVAGVDQRLVSYSPEGKLLGVRYQQMTALLAASIKELNERISKLEHPP